MKWAIVTGASSGIGLEFSKQLAAKGYSILMISNQQKELDDCARDIADAYGVGSYPLVLDLSTPNATREIINVIEAENIHPEILINNAGIFDFKKVSDLAEQRINTYIDLHIRAVTMLCRAIGEIMSANGHGHILNMASMSCWMPMPGIAMYASTKAYIRAFSRALRIELKDNGVSVTVACPGGISTSLFGLSEKLRRVAVRLGVLVTPEHFVKKALKKMFKGKAQYINGLLNRISIVVIASLPEWARIKGKRIAFDRKRT